MIDEHKKTSIRKLHQTFKKEMQRIAEQHENRITISPERLFKNREKKVAGLSTEKYLILYCVERSMRSDEPTYSIVDKDYNYVNVEKSRVTNKSIKEIVQNIRKTRLEDKKLEHLSSESFKGENKLIATEFTEDRMHLVTSARVKVNKLKRFSTKNRKVYFYNWRDINTGKIEKSYITLNKKTGCVYRLNEEDVKPKSIREKLSNIARNKESIYQKCIRFFQEKS